MTSVNKVKICPNCRAEISMFSPTLTIDWETCPQCGKSLKIPQLKNFGMPDYLHLQKDSLLEEGGPDKLKQDDGRYKELGEKIEQELTDLAKTCQDEDRVASMRDALKMIQESLLSCATNETLRTMTSIGRSIGKLSEAIEQYVKSGGQTNDRKVRRISPEFGDESWNQAAAAASRDS